MTSPSIESIIVPILREASSKQALRAWSLPYSDLDELDRAVELHKPDCIDVDKIFDGIICLFENIDEVIVALNGSYQCDLVRESLLAIILQEMVHDPFYKHSAKWWRKVRPDGLPDATITVPMPSANASVVRMVATSYVLEYCLLPLVFDLMYRIKPDIIGRYGREATIVYNGNDEIIGDENIHGDGWQACAVAIADMCDINDEIIRVGMDVWKLVCGTFGDMASEYRALYISRLDPGASQAPLRTSALAQSVRPFEGQRLGYLNCTDVDSTVTSVLSKRRSTLGDAVSPKRTRVDNTDITELESARDDPDKVARICNSIISKCNNLVKTIKK